MGKDKKSISKKTIGIIAGVVTAVVVIALAVVISMGVNRDFDAETYVRVILDYTFKGNANDAESMFDADSLTQLEKQYEENIVAFVEKNITSGIAMEAEMKEQYVTLCKDIFKAMKYKVKEVEKVSNDEYKVTVEYQAANVFPAYMEAASQEAAKIMEKVQRGEYQGTTEEINQQMQQETISNDCELLNTAYQNVQYGEKETFVFTVKRGENDLFALDSAQLSEFIVKIVGLDEIQD